MSPGRVAVIGAGLAGVAAAAVARRAGKEVTLIHKANGATSFFSGGLDLVGDPHSPPERPAAVCTDLMKNLERLLMLRPGHPYSILARGVEPPAEAVLSLLREGLALLFPKGAALDLEGGFEENQACFTTLGTIKFTALFPAHTARTGAPGMERPLVLGITGLSDFVPMMWAKVAKENAARTGADLEPVTGHLTLGASHQRPSPAVAAEIKRDPEALVRAVKDAIPKQREATSVVLPPVLPLAARAGIIGAIAESLSMPAYELLSLPPSMPGLRMTEHLMERAKDMGIEIIREEVAGYEAADHNLRAVNIAAQGDERRIEADAFVLAAGKFIGGGLVKRRAFQERIFDLPVFAGGSLVGEVFIEKVLGLHIIEPHPIFELGLKVDKQLRPMGQDGQPGFDNLFAAGAIIQGHNYMTDGTGAGVALATGIKAGMNAAALCSA